MNRIVVTGGLGFIGSSFVHHCVENGHEVMVVDLLTYAGDYDRMPKSNPLLVQTLIRDICDVTPSDLGEYDYLVNFAAESHVDNSIADGRPFVRTNVEGTFNLLECARQNPKLKRFVQISTDEVYGDLEKLDNHNAPSHPNDRLIPSSYYSSTKASADLLVQSCATTFGLPYNITRTCNNFGVRQHKEKFIPKIIHNVKNDITIPVYGDGKQMREWIWVEDNVKSILDIVLEGDVNEIYHIGSDFTTTNIDIINTIGDILGITPKFEFVEDRLGHDRKYRLHSYNETTKTLHEFLKEELVKI